MVLASPPWTPGPIGSGVLVLHQPYHSRYGYAFESG